MSTSRSRAASGPAGAGAGAPPPPPGDRGAGAGATALAGTKRRRADEEDTVDEGDEGEGSSSGPIPSGSKALVHQLYGPELGDILAFAAGRGKKYNYRAVMEPTDASDQCAAVIGEFTGGTPCYLCGFPIPSKKDLGMDPAHELYPECEHILPVTEARWYLDLYMTTVRATDSWTRDAFALEYAYAHRVCNQAKSNDSFVVDDGDGNPVVSDEGFAKILSNIERRARGVPPGGRHLPRHMNVLAGIANSIMGRRDTIQTEKINPIIEFVRRAPGVRNLILLGRAGELLNDERLLERLRTIVAEFTGPSREEREARFRAMLEAFRDGIYREYPQFGRLKPIILLNRAVRKPQALADDVWEGHVNDAVSNVDGILNEYFTRIANAKPKTPDDDGAADEEPENAGKELPFVVFYGVYLRLFTTVRELFAETPEDIRALCALYDMLMGFFERPPTRASRTEEANERIRVLTIVFGGDTPLFDADAEGKPQLTSEQLGLCKTQAEKDAAEAAAKEAAAEKARRDAEREKRRKLREGTGAGAGAGAGAEEDEDEDITMGDLAPDLESDVSFYFGESFETTLRNLRYTNTGNRVLQEPRLQLLADWVRSEYRKSYTPLAPRANLDDIAENVKVALTVLGYDWRVTERIAGLILKPRVEEEIFAPEPKRLKPLAPPPAPKAEPSTSSMDESAIGPGYTGWIAYEQLTAGKGSPTRMVYERLVDGNAVQTQYTPPPPGVPVQFSKGLRGGKRTGGRRALFG